MTLQELIRRLKKAPCASRVLDRAIYYCAVRTDLHYAGWSYRDDGIDRGEPHYTSSFDAAERMVPPGFDICMSRGGKAWVAERDGLRGQVWHGDGAEGPIGICIAELRRREATAATVAEARRAA